MSTPSSSSTASTHSTRSAGSAPSAPARLPGAPRLHALLAQLQSGLLERQTAAHLSLLAALAGEHVLLIGPPGTAKSELARRLHRAFAGAAYFERLLTRFSTPEELFGPLSLKALEDDRYERLTAGFLPTAGVAFLDEVFKANSAILNALLTLLNEREFDNGTGRQRTPLISVVAASNEVPSDEALQAFHDRFLLRVPVEPVSDAAFAALLALPSATGSTGATGVTPTAAEGCAATPAAALTEAERAALQAAAATVQLGPQALEACVALRAWLGQRQISVSDRRWRQWIGLMRVAAASEGRAALDRLDLWMAPYVVSATPQQVPLVAEWFSAELLGAVAQEAPWLTRAVEGFEQQLQLEQSAESEADADSGGAGKLALAQAIGGAGRGAEREGGSNEPNMMRLLSRTLEEAARRRYSPVHIAARVAQLEAILAPAQAQREQIAAQAEALAQQLAGRLWLPPTLAAQLLGAHQRTLATLDALLARLHACRAGFAALPEDASLPAQAPEPVALPA